jgi:DNA-binding IclR family transcriptional regulator
MPAKNENVRVKIVAALRKFHGKPLSRAQIAKEIGIAESEKHTLPLIQMKAEGLITQQGERGQARYTAAPKK